MPFESFSMGKCLGNSVQFSQGKPFKCNYHSYPSKALKRRTFHKCGHASWYKIISVAVSLCPAALIRVEIGTYLTFPINDEKGRQNNYDNQDQPLLFVVLLFSKN